jgi:hypothetical protein
VFLRKRRVPEGRSFPKLNGRRLSGCSSTVFNGDSGVKAVGVFEPVLVGQPNKSAVEKAGTSFPEKRRHNEDLQFTPEHCPLKERTVFRG